MPDPTAIPPTEPAGEPTGRTPADHVRLFLSTLAASGRPVASVESEADPHNPFRTAYRITSETRECVQATIDRLILEVESADHRMAHGRFTRPLPDGNGCFVSLGETMIIPSDAARFPTAQE